MSGTGARSASPYAMNCKCCGKPEYYTKKTIIEKKLTICLSSSIASSRTTKLESTSIADPKFLRNKAADPELFKYPGNFSNLRRGTSSQ